MNPTCQKCGGHHAVCLDSGSAPCNIARDNHWHQWVPCPACSVPGFTKDTQGERVLARIAEVGYVDNFWAIANYILRLGAVVHSIRHGLRDFTPQELIGRYGKDLNVDKQNRKNFYYMTPAAFERMEKKTTTA